VLEDSPASTVDDACAGCGVVEARGDAATKFAVGQRVTLVNTPAGPPKSHGTWCTYVAVPESFLVRIRTYGGFTEASAACRSTIAAGARLVIMPKTYLVHVGCRHCQGLANRFTEHPELVEHEGTLSN
jgi:hypothetical protein